MSVIEFERLAWQENMRDGDAADRMLWIYLHTMGLPIYVPVMVCCAVMDRIHG